MMDEKQVVNGNSNAVFAVSNISNVAETVLNQFPKKLRYTSLFLSWSAAVGTDFARISIPYKIIIQNNKKILILKSKKGRSVELQHCSQQILEKVHRFLGEDVFSFLRIIQLDGDYDF